MNDLQDTWQRLGERDPLWAILSDPSRRGGRWDLDEFLATADEWLVPVRRALEGAGLTLGRRVLDFGCGVGRLSNALAHDVEQVIGVDIAESMVRRARELVRDRSRVEFVSYDGDRLPFPDAFFDSAVSLIVLQHVPVRAQLAALLELVRVVRPGGVIALQVPSQLRLEAPEGRVSAEIEVLDAPKALDPGSRATVVATVRNVGSGSWPTGQGIRLGNHWWLAGDMVVQDDARCDLPHVIEPGMTVELTLDVQAPNEPGDYDLELDMVQEMVAWWSELGSTSARVPVTVGRTPQTGPGSVSVEGHGTLGQHEPHGIEMHPLPRELVEGILSHAGCRVEATVVNMAGPEYEDYLYLVQRGE